MKSVFDATFNAESLNSSNFNFDQSSFNDSGIQDRTLDNSELQNSLISNLTINETKTFQCDHPNCDFVAFSCMQLSTHKRSAHYQSKCSECGKSYANPKCLKQHQQRVHQKVAKTKCSLCSKGFYSKAALTIHQKTCGGENQETSARHNDTTENVEKYRLHCRMENCSVFYTSLSVASVTARRLRHERSHACEDKYQCYFCGLKFDRVTAFAEHLREYCEKREKDMNGALSVLEADLRGGVRQCYN